MRRRWVDNVVGSSSGWRDIILVSAVWFGAHTRTHASPPPLTSAVGGRLDVTHRGGGEGAVVRMPALLLTTFLLLLTGRRTGSEPTVNDAAAVGKSSGGDDDGGATGQRHASSSEDPPPAGDVTDAERALFASRSPACAACQRMVLHLDETLLPRALDEKAKRASAKIAHRAASSTSRAADADPSAYGRYEAMVEEEVSRACQASSIQLSRPIRRACEKMLEAREEDLVRAWYARVAQEEDWNMSWRLCRSSGRSSGSSSGSSSTSRSAAAAAASAALGDGTCPDGIARLEVPTLDMLEQEAKLAGMRQPLGDRTAGSKPKYQSQPAAAPGRGRGRAPGEVETFVGQDFYARAIADTDVDVLVYFAFPNTRPNVHAASLYTLSTAAEALAESLHPSSSSKTGGRKKNTRGRRRAAPVVLATLNAELNEAGRRTRGDALKPSLETSLE